MKLIDKDALVAEIEKLKGKVSDSSSYCNGWQNALHMLELSLDIIEVKEDDLEKESISWKDIPQLISIAERFETDVYLSTKRITIEDFYKEVLKRFKNMKGK